MDLPWREGLFFLGGIHISFPGASWSKHAQITPANQSSLSHGWNPGAQTRTVAEGVGKHFIAVVVSYHRADNLNVDPYARRDDLEKLDGRVNSPKSLCFFLLRYRQGCDQNTGRMV
jgi:hypothetical protein